MRLTSTDLYSGIGGFARGFEPAGIATQVFCEPNKQCQKVLQRHWPNIPIIPTIQELLQHDDLISTDIVCGGDPCPCRSRARGGSKSRMPDLSGYFLAVVARLGPRWVVRENVRASDDVWFTTGLEILGYRTVIVATNAAALTAQNRTRDFVVGCADSDTYRRFIANSQFTSCPWTDTEKYQQKTVFPCLSTHHSHYDARDGYVYNDGHLRTATSTERLRLAGFPDHWLDGFSATAVARMCGNAVVPGIVTLFGDMIVQAERLSPSGASNAHEC